jgi:hypothetical protein
LSTIQATYASCFTRWTFRCRDRGEYWRGPTQQNRTDGTDTSILRLKNDHAQNWALIFTDEASFRQDSTLYATQEAKISNSWLAAGTVKEQSKRRL